MRISGQDTSELEAAVEALSRDPGLPEAMSDYANRVTRLYADAPGAVAMMGDLGRFGVLAAMFCLPTPVTRAAMVAAIGPGVAGRARVTSHLNALEKAGVIEATPFAGRAQPLRPSAWLEGWMARWLEAMSLPSRRWWREVCAPPALSRDLLVLYLRQVLDANREGLDAFAPTPAVGRMMTLVGGHLFVLELVQATEALARLDEPVRFSRRAFARRFGISRAHVVDLCAEAARLGWLIRSDDRRLVVSRAFGEDLRRWTAIHFVLSNATQAGRLLPLMRGAAVPRPGA